MLETVKPEWRDPEFGHRLRQIREWKNEQPARPLVLVFGTSRAQMGVSPAAMGMPDGPTDPLVYNCGYRGGRPLWAWLNLMRLLDGGVKPDFVLIHLSLAETVAYRSAEVQFAEWGNRLSVADIRQVAPVYGGPQPVPRRVGNFPAYSVVGIRRGGPER